MRVIAGCAKSRRLKVPKGLKIRPTLDKVREALFDILGNDAAVDRVLDLYAGSGSLGIEAISRGAKYCTFVDNNPKCIKAIRENLSNLGFGSRSNVLRSNVSKALRSLEKVAQRFDLVFMDPPYGEAKISLQQVAKSDILSPHCVVVVEHYKKDAMPKEAGPLRMIKASRYGDTVLSFYRRRKWEKLSILGHSIL